MQSAPQANPGSNSSFGNLNAAHGNEKVMDGYTVETVTLSDEEFNRMFAAAGMMGAANDSAYDAGLESPYNGVRALADLTTKMVA